MSLTILVLVVIVALAAAFYIMTRRDGVAVPTAEPEALDEADGVVSDPVPVNGTAHISQFDRISWTRQFGQSSSELDEDTRLHLIHDLGLLRAPWCVPILEQACHEETSPRLRTEAQRALTSCRAECSA